MVRETTEGEYKLESVYLKILMKAPFDNRTKVLDKLVEALWQNDPYAPTDGSNITLNVDKLKDRYREIIDSSPEWRGSNDVMNTVEKLVDATRLMYDKTSGKGKNDSLATPKVD